MRRILEQILSLLARAIILKYKPEVIAVTGSVGKTSTKAAMATVLRPHFRLRSSAGSYNTEIGVPLTIIGGKTAGQNILGWIPIFLKALGLLLARDKNYPDMLVLEFAADHPGDIEKLIDLAPPRVGVLTAIAPAHTKFFKTLENIKEEKSKIVFKLPPRGIAVMNLDDEKVASLVDFVRCKLWTFGQSEEAAVRAADISYSVSGTQFLLFYRGASFPVYLKGMLGIGHVNACLAAIAVALAFKLNLADIAAALQNYKNEPGRMAMINGVKNTFLIDDTYNASPNAATAALEVLRNLPLGENSRKIVAFGDMLELGAFSEPAHYHLAEEMKFADFILLVGKNIHWTYLGLKKLGFNDKNLIYFDDSAEAGRYLQKFIRAGDIVLVKGSRGMKMERVIDELRAIHQNS